MIRKIRDVFVANIVSAAVGFAATVLLSKLLPVNDFGQYGYLYALAMIAVTTLDFASGTAFVVRYNRERMPISILANYNAIRLISLAVVCASLAALFLVRWSGISPAGKVFLASTTVAMLISMHARFYYQAVGRYRENGIVVTAINAARLLALTGIWLFMSKDASPGLSAIFVVLSLAQTVAAGFVLLYTRGDMKWAVSFRFDKELLRTIGLLGIGNVLIILMMRVDVFIIKHYLDYQQLGYYHVASSLCAVFPLITGSIMAVLLKEMSSDNLSGVEQKTLFKRQMKFLVPGMVITTILVLLARPTVELVFGQRYAMSIPLLQVVIVPFSMGVVFTPLESFYYSRQPHIVTIMKLIQLTATIVCSMLFVKAYGLIGVGYSALLVRAIGWAFLLGGMARSMGRSERVSNETTGIT